MSANKYANLPDIDTAPDVYETEDVFPSAHPDNESSEDESGVHVRSHNKGKNGEPSGREELDGSSMISPEEASKRFRKAERKQHRPRIQYTYPPSPTSDDPDQPTLTTPAMPLSQRLRILQAELASLETELSDPSNPLFNKERELESGSVDPGELIRGMVDVKGRLEKISKTKEGRGKLVSVVLGEGVSHGASAADKQPGGTGNSEHEETQQQEKASEVKEIAEIDRRVGELEKVVGSSNTALDELSPLPPPLLPLLTRLNSQLTLLTQPRHIDSISRRLKLLLSDLDRASAANTQHAASQRRQAHGASLSASVNGNPPPPAPTTIQDQLTPILTRLSPLLPHIPHILTRLRTLSALHTSAAAFETTLSGLEDEQRRVRSALQELEKAVEGVETSLAENEKVVNGNVKALEERVTNVSERVEHLGSGLSKVDI